MIKTLLTLILITTATSQAKNDDIIGIDFVKILNGNRAETLYYYENNWKYFRDIALEKNYIKSFSLIEIEDDDEYDILLITVFEDKKQFDAIEDRFKEVMADRKLKLMNEKKSSEFRKIVKSFDAKGVF